MRARSTSGLRVNSSATATVADGCQTEASQIPAERAGRAGPPHRCAGARVGCAIEHDHAMTYCSLIDHSARGSRRSSWATSGQWPTLTCTAAGCLA
jgi:hypothetical protein